MTDTIKPGDMVKGVGPDSWIKLALVLRQTDDGMRFTNAAGSDWEPNPRYIKCEVYLLSYYLSAHAYGFVPDRKSIRYTQNLEKLM
jgi:hypothetical protein